MIRDLRKYTFLISIMVFMFCIGCKNNDVNSVNNEILLYDSIGIVDSAVVYGCYSKIEQFYIDAETVTEYDKLKFNFLGNTNSDGSYVECLFHYSNNTIISIYKQEDLLNINKIHSFNINKPYDLLKIEIRIYINPPVCGQNEFKFTSVRNLYIYGIQ